MPWLKGCHVSNSRRLLFTKTDSFGWRLPEYLLIGEPFCLDGALDDQMSHGQLWSI